MTVYFRGILARLKPLGVQRLDLWAVYLFCGTEVQ